MPVVTNVEDLRQLAKKRVAKAIFDYVDRGSYDEATLRANRLDGAQLGRWRDAGRARRRALRRPLYALDDVDLLDRGRRDRRRHTFLVPAPRDARSRLRRLAHRARSCGEVFGAGADPRPAGPGPAPPGPEERPGGSSASDAWNFSGRAWKTILGVERAEGKTQIVRQPRRPHPERGQPEHAFAVDRRPVRPDAQLEGRRVGEESLGRQADPERHPRRRRREDRRLERRRRDRGLQPRRPPARRHRVVDPRAARSGQRGGRPHRGAVRRRRPLGPGRAQGARARRARRPDRPRFSLRPGRDGGKGRHPRSGNHPQRARRDDGAVRIARRQGRESGHPAALKSEKQLRPAYFERYIAASAFFRTVPWSMLSFGHSAAPMLRVESREWPSTWKGAWNAAMIFCPTTAASSGAERLLSTTANSSPPSRATVSEVRTDFESRCATCRISLSPTACPSVSLTVLKRSRSTSITPTVQWLRFASARVCCMRS